MPPGSIRSLVPSLLKSFIEHVQFGVFLTFFAVQHKWSCSVAPLEHLGTLNTKEPAIDSQGVWGSRPLTPVLVKGSSLEQKEKSPASNPPPLPYLFRQVCTTQMDCVGRMRMCSIFQVSAAPNLPGRNWSNRRIVEYTTEFKSLIYSGIGLTFPQYSSPEADANSSW